MLYNINKKEGGTLSEFSSTLCNDINMGKKEKAMRHNKILYFVMALFLLFIIKLKRRKKMKRDKVSQKEFFYEGGELCGSEIHIKGYIKNVEVGSYDVIFSFRDAISNEMIDVRISRNKLTPKKLQQIMKEKGGVNNDMHAMMRLFQLRESEYLFIRKRPTTLWDTGKKYDLDGTLIPEPTKTEPEIKHEHDSVGWGSN